MRFDDEPLNFEELAHLENLDAQIDQHLHGSMRALPNQAEALDPEFLRDLRAFYEPRDQVFQHALDRVWGHLDAQLGVTPAQRSQKRIGPIPRPGAQQERIYPLQRVLRTGERWTSRASALVAAVLLVVLVSALTLGLILVRYNGGSPTGGHPNNQPTKSVTTPFAVTSVDLTVIPNSISGLACGSNASFTYTATFHIPAGTAGGTIQFQYTLDNGRSSTSASVPVSAGQTTQTYTFTSSGTLPADHTYPGIAEVLVTSPNAVHSPQVQPSGSCVSSAFQVTSVSLEVSPASIAGTTCGIQAIVTYTATFHLAPGGPGGTIQFQYTVNNGRSTTPASITVAAGQTTATYSFTWSGALPADHTYPENGGVIVTSPNAAQSPMVAPGGTCS